MTTSPHGWQERSGPTRRPESMTARVAVARWWFAGVLSLALAVLLLCAVLGIPASYFSDPSPMLGFLRIVAVPGVPFAAFGAWYYLNGAIRPQHVTIDVQGITTPAWSLAWSEIKSAKVVPSDLADAHKQQLAFYVRPEAFERVRAANRGHSGRPFDMGGLPARYPVVRTQFGTTPSAGELFAVVQRHLEATPVEGGWRPPWPRALHRHVRPGT